MTNKEAIRQLNVITESLMNCGGCKGAQQSLTCISKAIKALEDRPTGRWKIVENQGWFSDIYICSCCGNTLDFHGVNGGRGSANFCPNCGADMRVKGELGDRE